MCKAWNLRPNIDRDWVSEVSEGGESMHRGSSIRLLNWLLVALALVGFAGALLSGCDRTISEDGSLLHESVR